MEKQSTSRTNDPAILHDIIADLEKIFEEKLKEKDQIIIYKNAEIEKLRFQLNKQLHHRFASHSEQSEFYQSDLFDEANPLDIDVAAVEQAEEEITVASHQRKKTGRKPLPANLPREDIIHDLADHDKVCSCGCDLHKIGEDVSEQLDIVPAKIKVLRHIRYKYGCRSCEEGVRYAPLPASPFPKSIASAGLISHVITSKYVDHLPLYRQEAIFKRLGVDMVRATLSHWVIRSAELLAPVVDSMKQAIIQCSYVQADETHLQVLGEPGRSNQRRSYLWAYRGVDPPEGGCVVFEYQPTRAGEHANNFLEGFTGKLQSDGYQGYGGLRAHPQIEGYGCMAHARRKFMDIVKVSKKAGKAHVGVSYIRKLYALEKHARENAMSCDGRLALRQEKAISLLDEFYEWLSESSKQVPPQSAIGKAIRYTLSQWSYLRKYANTGDVEIDNNHIENAIRPFAVGRRSWLFSGSVGGARASAILYSLAQTCKENNIEPYAYFKVVLQEVLACESMEDYAKCLPQAMDKEKLANAYR